MARRTMASLLGLGLLVPAMAWAFPQVPGDLKPNPPGLVRPTHLGAEWPHLNIDEKLYSLRFDYMRDSYQTWSKEHTVERTSAYPGLEEQFGITAFKILPPDYYGRIPHPDYHQPFTEWSANLTGATGLIDMPSAFTQKKGLWLASVGYSSAEAGQQYFPALYNQYDATDIRTAVTYGYRDDVELTATMNVYDRDLQYSNGARRSTNGRIFFGLGGKLGFNTTDDRYQIAVGGMFTFFSDDERDVIRETDYHTISNLYLVGSTDSRLFNAHFMYKWVAYDWRSSSVAPTAQIGNDPTTGLAPADDHWGELGIGVEYKLPKTRLSFITEFSNTGPLDFIARKDKNINFGVQGRMPGADVKVYTKFLNHDDFDEIGMISTFHF